MRWQAASVVVVSVALSTCFAAAPVDQCTTASGRQCFSKPPTCLTDDASGATCHILLSYAPTSDGSGVEFTLFARALTAGADFWAALGLSKDNKMTASGIVGCMNGKAISVGYAPNQSGVNVNEGEAQVVQVGAAKTGDEITCSFTIANRWVFSANTFELNSQLYLLLARGAGDAFSYHGFTEKVASPSQQVLSSAGSAVAAAAEGGADAYGECSGDNVDCYGLKNRIVDEACIADKSCAVLAIVKPGATPNGPADASVYATESKAGSYIAIGLSNDNQMTDTAIVECHNREAGAQAVVSYATSKELPAEMNVSAITDTEAAADGGVLRCDFKLASAVKVEKVDLTLEKAPLFILLATGSLAGERVAFHDDMGPSKSIALKAFGSTAEPKLSTTTQAPVNTAIPYASCGQGVGCFALPTPACIGDKNCQALLTYARKGDKTEFGLYRPSKKDNEYVAFGISNDATMPNTDIVGCIRFAGAIAAVPSHASGRSPPTKYDDKSKAVELVQSQFDGTMFSCVVQLPALVKFGSTEYNLNSNNFLLLAYGPAMSAEKVNIHDKKAPSSSAVDLSDVGILKAASILLIRLHASLMVLAWMALASTGMLLARHYKKLRPGKKLMGVDTWFALHRPGMTLAATLTVTAFVVIVIFIGGVSENTNNIHPLLGLLTVIGAIIQPIMALFRPHPGEPKRWIFNWAHFLVGWVTLALGLVTISLGVQLDKFRQTDTIMWVVYGFIIWLVVFELALDAHRLLTTKDDRPVAIAMAPVNGSDPHANGAQAAVEESKPASPPGYAVKVALLGIHALIALACTIVLIVTFVTWSQGDA